MKGDYLRALFAGVASIAVLLAALFLRGAMT